MDRTMWLLVLGVGLGIAALVLQPPKPASASTKGVDGFGRYVRG